MQVGEEKCPDVNKRQYTTRWRTRLLIPRTIMVAVDGANFVPIIVLTLDAVNRHLFALKTTLGFLYTYGLQRLRLVVSTTIKDNNNK